jgi:hypothetical protein
MIEFPGVFLIWARYGIDAKIGRPIIVSGMAAAQTALLRFDDHAATSSAKARAAI